MRRSYAQASALTRERKRGSAVSVVLGVAFFVALAAVLIRAAGLDAGTLMADGANALYRLMFR